MDQIQGQVRRVSRRLFWQSFLNRVMWFWFAALMVAVVWFLLQPLLIRDGAEWIRWTVAGGVFAVCTIAALVVSVVKAPSAVTAALSLDHEFNLRERITTCLMLPADQASTPAGQALLSDAMKRVESLDVGSKFPVQMSWNAALVPAGALALSLVALFYQPTFSQAEVPPDQPQPVKPEAKAEVEKKVDALKKQIAKKGEQDRIKSSLLKELEDAADKIVNKPRQTKEQMRDRVREMTSLTDKMKDQIRKKEEQANAVRQQLRDMNKAAEQNKSDASKDGPAKDINDALSKGDMNKAKDAIEKLAKKIANNELSKEDKEKLKQQLKDLQEKIERAADLKDKEDQLKKANLDPETLKREMKNLEDQKEKLKDLKDLANKLDKCKDCMDKGDMDQAVKDLQDAADKVKDIDLNEQELEDLKDQLDRMEDAKGEMAKAGREGNQQGNQDGDGGQEGGIGSGRRPLGDKKPFKSFDAKQKGDFDPKGKKAFDSFTNGRNFKKKTNVEIAGEIEQASQVAPEAIEQQRIPKGARDMAKGYFQNLAGQSKDKAPEKKKSELDD